MRKSMMAAVDRLTAEVCRESFYQFFLEFWGLTAAETLVPNWHIEKLCDELQVASERVFVGDPKEYDLICNCPPGTSKSTIFSILWQPWVWTRMPSARFISGSYAESLALDHSRKSRDVVMSEKYRRLFPEIRLRDDQNTKGHFANNYGGIRKAVGVGGSIVGVHGHFIIVDDPIDPQGVLSDLIIKECNLWMTETLSRRKVDLQTTFTALVMQRLHQIDPTGDWLDRGGRVRHVKLPADLSWEVKPAEWAGYYTDGFFDPVRLPQSALDEALSDLKDVGYAGQYGQEPAPRGGGMFKTNNFRTEPAYKIPKKWKRQPTRYWDKAATKGAGAFSAGVKMAVDLDDRLWVLDVRRKQLDSKAREKYIQDTARGDGKLCFVWMEQEPGGSGKESVETSCRALARLGFVAKPDRVTDDKVVRADTWSVEVNSGSVILVEDDWNAAYISEHKYFPNSKYKDQVDASSGCYAKVNTSRKRIGVV